MLNSFKEIVKEIQEFNETASETELNVILLDSLAWDFLRRRHQPLENVPEVLVLKKG